MVSTDKGDRDPLPGRRLADRYLVEHRLARGGMAHVYQAHDGRLDRSVAVKVLASPFADDPAYVSRFLDEARIAAGISHPNLAHVYDSGEDEGVQFIVLELLEGHRSLRDELAERGRLPVADAIQLAREVLAGLAPLHAHGLVHCDVKPGNVLIGRSGTKLIDFGIARPLRQPTVGPTSIGSLHSMSPEQLRGEGLTPASDIFSVGVVLYQAVTGSVPFGGETPATVAQAQAAGPPPAPSTLAPDVPEPLDAVILEALETDPSRRFASTEAMDIALQAAMPDEGPSPALPEPEPDEETTSFVPVAPSPMRSRPTRSSRPGRRPAWLVAILAVVAVPAVVAFIVINGLGTPRPPADATTGSPTPRPTQGIPAGKVEVPDTVGMSEEEAEAAARAAGLDWRLEWRVNPSQEAGVYDQKPAPGTVVDEGAPFVMYAYRTR